MSEISIEFQPFEAKGRPKQPAGEDEDRAGFKL